MPSHPVTPKPATHTHTIGPGAALAEVAETVHNGGECERCSRPDIDEDGHVYLNGEHIGSVHQGRRICGKPTWYAVDTTDTQVPKYGNRVRKTPQAAAEMLAQAVRHGE